MLLKHKKKFIKFIFFLFHSSDIIFQGIADVDADGNRRRAQIQRMLSKKMKPWIPY